ncbi:MAG TPA: MlaD family protein [Oligoflexia bacterium]|nr:MlaD family protein [Oligoflexia bacterium]HMR24795.1 MlaD family protein [Oligoflexia bacterium]
MKNLSSDFSVGLFALIALLVVIFLSLEVNDKGTLGAGAKTYYAHFESVSGLVDRTPVEIAGIMVGYVESIELDGNKAKVTLKIQRKMKVYQDAQVAIKDRGVLGDKYLALSQGTPETGELKGKGFIQNTTSKSDFDELSSSVKETAQIIKDLLSSDEPKGALGETLVNLRDTTARLSKLMEANQNQINSIVDNMDSFSKDLASVMRSNKQAISDTLASVQDTLGEEGELTQALASLNKIMSKIENGEGTVGKLVSDETTINKINDTIDGVNDTIGMFRKMQLGIRYRAEFLQSDKEIQNLVAIAIAPSPDKYLMFEVVDSPVGDIRRNTTTVSSGGNVISSTQTVNQNDRLVFNVQLAKRLWNATFRAGVFRNTGGIGMDLHLLENQLVLSTELFNASRENDAIQFRAYGSLYLYKHLMLTAGMDDILSEQDRQNLFFGAGVRFTDSDLKSFIPAMGAAF